MTTNTLANLYSKSFKENWDHLAFSDFEGTSYKYKGIAKIIKSLHLFYQVMGIQKGDKIAILGRNSSHWGSVFISSLACGTVAVPILPDFNAVDTNHIINHSEAKLIFAAKPLIERIDFDKAGNLKAIVCLEDFSLHLAKEEDVVFKLKDAFNYYEENPLSPNGFDFYDWGSDEMCVISYTSGTSGFTKGVMIPARSLASNIVFAQGHMPLKQEHRIISFLPMAHVYGLLFEFLFPVTLGCHITFLSKTPSPAIITKAFAAVKPNLILSVPLIIEKIYKKRIQPTLDKPIMKVMLKIPGISSLILKKVRGKLVETFGGRFFEIVIGGAPLSADVEDFFKRIKFPFTIGYGMTECGPLISYEAWDKTMPSSAGKLVDRMEVRIDSDDPFNKVGEIQVRGENIMLGYYKNEEATKEAFTDDGWLKTGDLGVIDKNNFIYIRGRSKNMLLGPSGQNIYPEEIEAKMSNAPYVAECVVKESDGKLIALVYPDLESIKADNINDTDLARIMDKNKKNVNSELPRYEQISEVRLVEEEFEKTPKRTIKRYKYI
ncbi:Long-chain-fatty-acid--CoA ligase [hydrothermal vent metagenome]|uniref:Long-chain-fatty-acid--CoA ligase n=1 Tax=hydrothermal vent metagenome TaxID=652676 RepID=A0A3B0UHS5_9ZZZZ